MRRALVLLAVVACGSESIVAPPDPGPPVSIEFSLGARRSGTSCAYTFTVVGTPASIEIGYELTRSGSVFGRGTFSGRLVERWQSTDVTTAVEYRFTVGAWVEEGGVGVAC